MMIATAASLSSCRPALAARCPTQPRPQAKRLVVTRAFAPEIVQIAADAAPGSVDAPIWAIAVGALVVTAASFAISLGLKPGTDAAIEMQKRDAKKFKR